MKTRDFKSVYKQLIHPAFPDFRLGPKRLVYNLSPDRYLLYGFYFEPSREANRFFVQAFVQPLFVKSEYLTFTWGRRLDADPKSNSSLGRQGWDLESISNPENASALIQSMQEALQENLRIFGTVAKVINHLKNFAKSADFHWVRELSYALVLEGRFDESAQLLEQALHTLLPAHRWQHEILHELKSFSETLKKSNALANQLLQNSVHTTLASLALPTLSET